MDNSKSIVDHPFVGDTVFVLGNEVNSFIYIFLYIFKGYGLNEKAKGICDQFVYIP